MSNSASVWAPAIQTEISGNTKSVSEVIVATEGQVAFNLTTFEYARNTGALEIYKQGLLVTPLLAWEEVSSTMFTLTTPASSGDIIVAVGKVGITGAVNTCNFSEVSAAASAVASEASAVNSEASAVTSEAASVVSLSAANYIGEWSTLSGAAFIYASVSHNDSFYMLLVSLADVTLSEPGVTADWQAIQSITNNVALGLNVAKNAVQIGIAGTTISATCQYLYVPNQQTTYGLPANAGAGEVIVSVVDDVLQTNADSYILTQVERVVVNAFNRADTSERLFYEFGGKGDYLLYQLNPIARHFPFKTTSDILNPSPTDNSAAMAAAMAAQSENAFRLIVEPGHYYFTEKTHINKAFYIEARARSTKFNYLQRSDCMFYLDSADSSQSIFEFEADVANLTNTNMQGSTLKGLFFKQINQTTVNQHMIRCHNVGWSYSTFEDLTFWKTTGYGMYFISDYDLYVSPFPYQTTYFQSVDFTRFSFQQCGGTIGGNEVSDRFATKGKLKNWNCEGTINQVSPQPWFLNLRGMKDYDLENVIMEGAETTGINSVIKIGNFSANNDTFRSELKGLWIEYLTLTVPPILAGQCSLEFDNLNTAVVSAQADALNFISFTKPYSTAKFKRSNLYPWGANLCLFNGLEKNISVEIDGCNIRDAGALLAGKLARQSRYKVRDVFSELGGESLFSGFDKNVTMYQWDGVSTTGGGVVTLVNNADTSAVVSDAQEGAVLRMTKSTAFTTFQVQLNLSTELIGQDVIVGWRLNTDFAGAKLATYTSAANYEGVVYINQTIDEGDKTGYVNCYAVLSNIKVANPVILTLPTTGGAGAHALNISDIVVVVGDVIPMMLPGRV